MRNYIGFLWLIYKTWGIKTLWTTYNTPDKWEKDGCPLDIRTAYEVAKTVWLGGDK